MKDILFFRLARCPHCINEKRWMDELIEENPEYLKINITNVDEREESDLADSYDYYLVPTYFSGDLKLHEGIATKEKIKAVLDYALNN